MKLLWLAALVLTACGSAAAPGASVVWLPPAGVEQAALGADDSVRSAFAAGDGRDLDAVLAAPALLELRRQVDVLAARGFRREELVDSRRVVHASQSADEAEVVLEVRARSRLAPVGAQAPFATVLRQTRVHLIRRGGSWRVDGWADLRPDQWWR